MLNNKAGLNFISEIVKILNLYIILLCTHLYHTSFRYLSITNYLKGVQITYFSEHSVYWKGGSTYNFEKLDTISITVYIIVRIEFSPVCCIFRPAFGCCARQTLVEIVIFSVFCAKKCKKKARNLQQISAKNSFFLFILKFPHTMYILNSRL